MFKELIVKLAGELNLNSIPYMIIGGQAVILYGEPRLTRDIDITIGAGPEKLPEILKVLSELSLRPLPEDPSAFVKKTMVLPALEESSGIRVDFIFSFSPYEREALRRAKKVFINQAEVNFASLEDIIIHKLFAGRARDLEDVKNIVLKNPGFNLDYIKKWLAEFDAAFPEAKFNDCLMLLLKANRQEKTEG